MFKFQHQRLRYFLKGKKTSLGTLQIELFRKRPFWRERPLLLSYSVSLPGWRLGGYSDEDEDNDFTDDTDTDDDAYDDDIVDDCFHHPFMCPSYERSLG